MALTNLQKSALEKARASGAGTMGVSLSDEACNFLIATIANDLRIRSLFPELRVGSTDFFSIAPIEAALSVKTELYELFERLVTVASDADTYFSCLAALHRSRLKYARILEHQPIPTMDQVGPRSLLQFGTMRPHALATFLLWRKWIFDIDNRAGQETGYLFEPIIAHAIGGVPFGSRRSLIRRQSDNRKGRQVDCIRDRHAYEFKIRVTIAASGQGRWREELEFPVDCRNSGYTPVLVVLDPTANPKLQDLVKAFEREKGDVYVGDDAWAHLEAAAGKTMALFLEKYVRGPIQLVLRDCPEMLPDLTLAMSENTFTVSIGADTYSFPRAEIEEMAGETALPEDIDDETPGL
jgi:hypothetical protein